jgi:hypothetical protein
MSKWHIVEDQQNLRKSGGVFVRQVDKDGNEIQPTGNIALIINGATASNFDKNGNVKPSMEGNIVERCAVCRLETGQEEFGVFSQEFCTNCGAPKYGIGIPEIDLEKLKIIMENEVVTNSEDDRVAKDGLPRKVALRDDLHEAGVVKGIHFSKLEYREILDDNDLPEGVPGKCKYLKIIDFKEEKSPLTLREIEELIGIEQIVVRVD